MKLLGAGVMAILLTAAVGCGGKKEDGGGKAKPKVALELTGEITLSLKGEGGECTAGAGGMKTERGFSIATGELGAPAGFALILNGLTDGPSEGATFVRMGDTKFLRTPGASTTVTEANLFTVDSTLKAEASDKTVVVKGTVQCP